MTYRSKAFRDLCRDRSCACCGAQDGTIVPAHRNGGGLKGMGLKSPDSWVLPLCFGCHKDYDEGRWRDAVTHLRRPVGWPGPPSTVTGHPAPTCSMTSYAEKRR